MNDIQKPVAAPLFTIPAPKFEKLPTQNFGTVTVSAPSPAFIEKLVGAADKTKDPDIYYRQLVAECVTGEHGERFTPALLASLPGNCYVDWLQLRAAAIRVCGLSQEDNEKN